jgi:hypothetical protein
MKKLIITLAALMVSIAAYGQGQLNINNRIGTEVNARFIGANDAAGTSSIGTPDWTVQLLGGPVGGTLVPLTPTTAFRGAAGTASAGYFTGVSPIIPGVDVGGTAAITVRVMGPGGFQQDFPYTSPPLGGGTVIPPNLQMGTSPLVINTVPEPTTLALGALGIGALLMIRRRK